MDEVKPTGIAGSHAKAETAGTAARTEAHKKATNLRKIAIVTILVIAGIYFGYQWFPGEGSNALSFSGRLFIGFLIIVLAVPIAKLLEVVGFTKEVKGIPMLVAAAGGLVIAISIATSGIGYRIGTTIEHIDNCARIPEAIECVQSSKGTACQQTVTTIQPGETALFERRSKCRGFEIRRETNLSILHTVVDGSEGVQEYKWPTGGERNYPGLHNSVKLTNISETSVKVIVTYD